MSYLNMVERLKFLEDTTKVLDKPKTVRLRADNITDSIFKMEYLPEFLHLSRDQEKIAWALSSSDAKIISWHERRGKYEKIYSLWSKALRERFLIEPIEREKFQNRKQAQDEKLSDFLAEVQRISRSLKEISLQRKAEIILKNVRNKKDSELLKMLLKESRGVITENVLRLVDRIEGMYKHDDQPKPNNMVNLALALRMEKNYIWRQKSTEG